MAGWMLRPVPHSEQKPAGAPSGAAPAGTRAAKAGNPPAVRPDAVPSAQTDAASGLEQRLAKLEATVAQMQAALDGVSIEKASADRLALFTAEEGYLKADEYFEAGKFAIAGEGYLAFLQKYPTHPDSRDIMKKARDAFWRAGYKDKSLWVQDEMMKAFPGHQAEDIMEQAKLEKEAGRLDKAIEHAAEAAALANSSSQSR